jgi:hypothetical protein
MLDPIWTPKLRNARPGEYLAGGPPGKPEESTRLYSYSYDSDEVYKIPIKFAGIPMKYFQNT